MSVFYSISGELYRFDNGVAEQLCLSTLNVLDTIVNESQLDAIIDAGTKFHTLDMALEDAQCTASFSSWEEESIEQAYIEMDRLTQLSVESGHMGDYESMIYDQH